MVQSTYGRSGATGNTTVLSSLIISINGVVFWNVELKPLVSTTTGAQGFDWNLTDSSHLVMTDGNNKKERRLLQ